MAIPLSVTQKKEAIIGVDGDIAVNEDENRGRYNYLKERGLTHRSTLCHGMLVFARPASSVLSKGMLLIFQSIGNTLVMVDNLWGTC